MERSSLPCHCMSALKLLMLSQWEVGCKYECEFEILFKYCIPTNKDHVWTKVSINPQTSERENILLDEVLHVDS